MSLSQAAAAISNPSSCSTTAASPSAPLHLILAGHMLPVQQEAQEIGGADRLDVRAQAAQRVAMDAREQAAVAPLELGSAWREAAAQDPSLRLEA